MTPALPFRHRQGLTSLIAFVGLVAIYLVTAPGYHTTAIDSYDFAHTITEKPFFAAGMRLFLWITAMQGLYAAVSWIVPDPDPFVIIGVANALQAAGAVVLFQRLLFAHMGVPGPAAWLTAGLFAFSYGTWRYATELEVYAFVMLASLALLNLAFSADRTRPAGRATYLVLVAVFAAVVTLSYQPLGIVAGFAVPVYFLLRLPVRATGLYMAVYGGLIALGLWFIQMLKGGHLSGRDATGPRYGRHRAQPAGAGRDRPGRRRLPAEPAVGQLGLRVPADAGGHRAGVLRPVRAGTGRGAERPLGISALSGHPARSDRPAGGRRRSGRARRPAARPSRRPRSA